MRELLVVGALPKHAITAYNAPATTRSADPALAHG